MLPVGPASRRIGAYRAGLAPTGTARLNWAREGFNLFYYDWLHTEPIGAVAPLSSGLYFDGGGNTGDGSANLGATGDSGRHTRAHVA